MRVFSKTTQRSLFAATMALGLGTASAQAEIIRCEFAKVTSIGMGSKANTRNFLGEAVSFNTDKKAVQVEWKKGKSQWMPAENISRNNSFTSYVIYEDVKFPEGTLNIKFSFRLYNDQGSAQVRSEPQEAPGPSREWRPNAARYTCS